MASVYDLRMQEIAAQREAERCGLDRIEESTETINRGVANPFVWMLCIAAIVGIPFTSGLSVGLGVIALLLLTGGGKAYAQAIPPTMADVAAPGLGCARILLATGSLAILLLVVCLFGLILWANATGNMR